LRAEEYNVAGPEIEDRRSESLSHPIARQNCRCTGVDNLLQWFKEIKLNGYITSVTVNDKALVADAGSIYSIYDESGNVIASSQALGIPGVIIPVRRGYHILLDADGQHAVDEFDLRINIGNSPCYSTR